MTDPLLTIDEATRAFRTSPKTIRRRLAAGEIAGAYKRPGGRGPEWVMPEGSLRAAGFVPRVGADAAILPADPGDRASYWERRALDAEAALRSSAPPARRRSAAVIVTAVLIGLAVLVIAFVAGRTTAHGDAAAPSGAGADLVHAMLTARTETGDAVGVIGTVPADVVPAGRPVQQLDGGDGGAGEGRARYVVVAPDGRQADAFDAVRASAELLLAVPQDAPSFWVYDSGRRPGSRSPGGEPPGAEPAPDVAEVPSTPEEGGAAEAPAPARADGSIVDQDPSVGAAPVPLQREVVTVAPGDSFWTIAADAVAGADLSDAVVAQYWEVLMDANADRLVEPGNPDLLHVGQDLILPPAP